MLERVSGQRYETVIRDTLFDPLGMHSATSLQTRTTGLATGYDRDGITPIPYWHMIQRPAAAINATVRDVGALVAMLLNRGHYRQHTVLTPAELRRMETPRTSLAARNGLQFGYGLGMYSYYRNQFRFMGHGGDGDGYLSRLGYCQQLAVGYFVAINSYNPPLIRHLHRLIEDALTRDHTPAAAPPLARLDAGLLRRYSGHYVLATRRFGWQSAQRSLLVSAAEEGSLYTQEGNGERKLLLPVTAKTFRRADDNDATSGFFEDGGKLFFQDEDNWIKVAEATQFQD